MWPVRLRVALQHEGQRHHGDCGHIMRSVASRVSAELTSLLGDAGRLELLRIEAADIDVTWQDPDGCPVAATATAHLTLLIAADTYAGARRIAIAVLRLRLLRARTFTADFDSAETMHSRRCDPQRVGRPDPCAKLRRSTPAQY